MAIVGGKKSNKPVFQLKFKQITVSHPCSGVRVSDYSFLTAAHCVDHLDLSKKMFLITGKHEFKIEAIYIPLEFYPAIGRYQKAQEDNKNCKKTENCPITYTELKAANSLVSKFDIAIINLSQKMPSELKISFIHYSELKIGKSYEVVGTGFKKYNPIKGFFDDNNERTARVEPVFKSPDDIFYFSGRSLNDYLTGTGDSGAAIFNKEGHVIALNRGTYEHDGKAGSLLIPLSKHKAFIKKYLKK